MSITNRIMWWGAILLLTIVMFNYATTQFDKSPTVHPPTVEGSE